MRDLKTYRPTVSRRSRVIEMMYKNWKMPERALRHQAHDLQRAWNLEIPSIMKT